MPFRLHLNMKAAFFALVLSPRRGRKEAAQGGARLGRNPGSIRPNAVQAREAGDGSVEITNLSPTLWVQKIICGSPLTQGSARNGLHPGLLPAAPSGGSRVVRRSFIAIGCKRFGITAMRRAFACRYGGLSEAKDGGFARASNDSEIV